MSFTKSIITLTIIFFLCGYSHQKITVVRPPKLMELLKSKTLFVFNTN